MQNHLGRGKRRASALLVLVSCVFILLTIVVGLHYRQSSARATLMREEANLQARLAAEYELVKLVQPQAPLSTPRQAVAGELQHASALEVEGGYAAAVLSGARQANLLEPHPLSFDQELSALPGLSWNEVRPTTGDPGMRPDKARFVGVISDYFPLVAWAPKGSVRAEKTWAWRNRAFASGTAPQESEQEARSGGPARIAARGDIRLDSCEYGELYSQNGHIAVGQGQVLAFRGVPFGLSSGSSGYAEQLRQRIVQARTRLSAVAQDKTAWLTGPDFSSEAIWGLLTGNTSLLTRSLSLRQALSFPFLLIPGASHSGLCIQVWLHVPYGPDDAALQSHLNTAQQLLLPSLEVVTQRLQQLQSAEAELQSRLAQAGAGERPALQAQLQALQGQQRGLQSQLQALGEQLRGQLQARAPGRPEGEPGPVSRAQEASLAEEGPEGWAYGPVLNKFWGMVRAFTPPANLGQLPGLFVQRLRLLHFGDEQREARFRFGEGRAELHATFNVPAGRAHKLRSHLTIRGDLWLQRGASLVVDGDLQVLSPQATATDDPRVPQGKIFLEEGATLIVTGDLTCQGAPRVGSVLVGSPYGRVHPTSAAILVTGDVNIPHAVLPAFSLADADSDLASLRQFAATLYEVVPNLAKLDGPFHPRRPFFARYASSFQIWYVPGPLGPVAVPTCVPQPSPKNVQNPILQLLALVYATQMNLAWGENFVTHTDWWFPGQQVVPMYPKVAPAAVRQALGQLNWPTLVSAEQVSQWLRVQGQDFATRMTAELLNSVLLPLVAQQYGLPVQASGDLDTTLAPLRRWTEERKRIDSVQAALTEMSALVALKTAVQNETARFNVSAQPREVPGVLIYAGKNLSVAVQGEPAPLSVGMLVAEGEVRCLAQRHIGAVLSLGGNVVCRELLYEPQLTRCSLYVPRAEPRSRPTGTEWLDWALETGYGPAFSSQQALDVTPPLPHLTLQGWKQ